MKSVFGIYMMYQDGEIQEALDEIESYGCAFWTDLKFFLMDNVPVPQARFLTVIDLVTAFEYRKAR